MGILWHTICLDLNEDLGPKSTSFHRFVDPIQTSMLAGQITPDFLETMVPPVQALQSVCASESETNQTFDKQENGNETSISWYVQNENQHKKQTSDHPAPPKIPIVLAWLSVASLSSKTWRGRSKSHPPMKNTPKKNMVTNRGFTHIWDHLINVVFKIRRMGYSMIIHRYTTEKRKIITISPYLPWEKSPGILASSPLAV